MAALSNWTKDILNLNLYPNFESNDAGQKVSFRDSVCFFSFFCQQVYKQVKVW